MKTIAHTNKTTWWPKLIIATFILFSLYIGFMVRRAMLSDVDLVSADYYKKEMAYQQHIDQVSQTQELTQQVSIVHAAAAEQLSLGFPEIFAGQPVTGSIRFFRPSDAKLDFAIPLHLNGDRQQHLSTARLTKGFWRVAVSWEAVGKQYFMQQDLTLK